MGSYLAAVRSVIIPDQALLSLHAVQGEQQEWHTAALADGCWDAYQLPYMYGLGLW